MPQSPAEDACGVLITESVLAHACASLSFVTQADADLIVAEMNRQGRRAQAREHKGDVVATLTTWSS